MDHRKERLTKNQLLFQALNDRIRSVGEQLDIDPDGSPSEYVCECSDGNCTEPILLTRAEYESLRRDLGQFALVPAHVRPEIEALVAENERYVVVRKLTTSSPELASEADAPAH